MDDSVLEAAASPRLQRLHIRRCRAITDRGVAAVATAAGAALADLSLAETPATAAALDVLAAHCPGLTALHLRQCTRVKDEAPLIAIAQHGALRRLDVSLVPAAGGALLLELAASCARTLESLDMSFCRGVAPNALGHMLDACAGLREVRVFGCSQLTRAALRGHCNVEVEVRGEPTLEGGARPQAVPATA